MHKVIIVIALFACLKSTVAQPLYYVTSGDTGFKPALYKFGSDGTLLQWKLVHSSAGTPVTSATYSPADGMFYIGTRITVLVIANPASFMTPYQFSPELGLSMRTRVKNSTAELLVVNSAGISSLNIVSVSKAFSSLASISGVTGIGLTSQDVYVIANSTLGRYSETTKQLEKMIDIHGFQIDPNPEETELYVSVDPDGYTYAVSYYRSEPLKRFSTSSGSQDTSFAPFVPREVFNTTVGEYNNIRNLQVLWNPPNVSVIDTTFDNAVLNITLQRYSWTSSLELQVATVDSPIFTTLSSQSYSVKQANVWSVRMNITLPKTAVYRFRMKYVGVSNWVGYSLHTEIQLIKPSPPVTPVAPPVKPPVTPPVAPIAPPVKPPVTPPVAPPVRPPITPPVAPPVKPPVTPPVAPPVKPPVTPPVAPIAPPVKPPVTPPVAPPVRPPVTPPVAPPVNPPVRPPVTPPVAPPVKPPVAPPVTPPITPVAPPVIPPITPPVTPPVAPPVNPPVTPPLAPPVTPPVTPIAPPITPPVAPPIEPPIVPPVTPPLTPPVAPPVNPPITPPVTPPIEPPIVPPVDAPIMVPVEAPIEPPVDAPIDMPAPVPTTPINPPIDPPTEVPIESPVNAPIETPMQSYEPVVDTPADAAISLAIQTNASIFLMLSAIYLIIA